MPEAERVTVELAGAGQRLDRYLAALHHWGSRSRVQRLIQEGCIRIGGRVIDAATVLRLGDVIEIEAGSPLPAINVEPEAIALDVLFEDEWILVIDKPAGLVVHPAPGHAHGTLVAALLHHWQGAHPGLDPARPGIVHRLDKDTSGVLLIAKDPGTLAHLGKQFHDRQVNKTYLAAVWGRPRAMRGTIDQPIGRNPTHRKKMAVRSGGRSAVTAYEVIRTGNAICWLRLWPRTGRTHQIRVHLAALGHPIIGDRTYGRARTAADVAIPDRQALHAERLAFLHPQTGTQLAFSAPLPKDLQPLWQATQPIAQRGSGNPTED